MCMEAHTHSNHQSLSVPMHCFWFLPASAKATTAKNLCKYDACTYVCCICALPMHLLVHVDIRLKCLWPNDGGAAHQDLGPSATSRGAPCNVSCSCTCAGLTFVNLIGLRKSGRAGAADGDNKANLPTV
jgi:hypothetical protein